MSKTHTQQDVAKAIGGVIRARIEAFGAQAKDIRSRELRKNAPGADICPLCAEPDVGGHCACTKAHQAKKSQDPVGMSDGSALAMSELCKSCGLAKCGPGCSSMKKTMGGTGDLGNWDEARKECKVCGSKHVKVRQDGGLVSHDAPGGKVCNGKRVIKEEIDSAGMTKDELSDDKKAAGVGPINAIASKFKKPAPAAPDTGKGPIKGSRGMGAAGMAALARGEKAPGAKMPKAGKPVKISKPGSGGELRKDTMGALVGKDKFKPEGSMGAPKLPGMTPKAPGVVGVAGKQPVGMGGGDAHKAAPGMHPETAAGLADVKGLAPGPAGAAKWKAQGLPGLKSKLGDVAAAKIPITEAPAQAAAKPAAAANPAADLKADKKAAGVGFLNALISRFRKPAAEAPVGTGPVRSQASPYAGVRGMAALARSEACGQNLFKAFGDCPLCGTSEHLGRCPR